MKDRLNLEKNTIGIMIRLFCKKNHKSSSIICKECSDLLFYAYRRIETCKFSYNKPVCGRCKIHCYSPRMREKVRDVMRFAGPRMLLKHPVITFGHLVDCIRYKPLGDKTN